MTPAKKKALARKGWKIGTVAEFLRLTPEEIVEVERRVAESEAHIPASGKKKHP